MGAETKERMMDERVRNQLKKKKEREGVGWGIEDEDRRVGGAEEEDEMI